MNIVSLFTAQENTNDVRNSPLFSECCYFKTASTRCKAILVTSPNVFLNTDVDFYCLLVVTQFMYSLNKIRCKYYLNLFNRSKRDKTVAKQTSLNGMCRTVTLFYFYRMQLFWQILKTFLCHCLRIYGAVSVISDKILYVCGDNLLNPYTLTSPNNVHHSVNISNTKFIPFLNFVYGHL